MQPNGGSEASVRRSLQQPNYGEGSDDASKGSGSMGRMHAWASASYLPLVLHCGATACACPLFAVVLYLSIVACMIVFGAWPITSHHASSGCICLLAMACCKGRVHVSSATCGDIDQLDGHNGARQICGAEAAS